MSNQHPAPVLVIGGSGVVGAQAAAMLRRFHPALPLAIGGRNRAKAERVAASLRDASAVHVDIDVPGLALSEDARFSAIVVFVKDAALNALDYAQRHGLPHVSVSSGVFEVGPEMARHIHRPTAAPILMASNWLAGAATFPTLVFARDFRRIDTIAIAAVLDEEDMGGPAAYADFDRLTTAAPHALMLKDGRWLWATGADAARNVRDVGGNEVVASAYSPLDVLSLAETTGAPNIRFDLVYGQSSSRRRGEPFSTEIIIEIDGEGADGDRLGRRYELVHPDGQAPLTALGVTLAVERLLGLAGGSPVAPGLYLPEVLIEPAYALQRMREIGTTVRQV